MEFIINIYSIEWTVRPPGAYRTKGYYDNNNNKYIILLYEINNVFEKNAKRMEINNFILQKCIAYGKNRVQLLYTRYLYYG